MPCEGHPQPTVRATGRATALKMTRGAEVASQGLAFCSEGSRPGTQGSMGYGRRMAIGKRRGAGCFLEIGQCRAELQT